MTGDLSARISRQFDPDNFLRTNGVGKKILSFPKNHVVFAQGAATDAVFYIQRGKVKLTVVSRGGREATIGILNQGTFFGEGGLAGQSLRMSTASTMTECSVTRITNMAMLEVLHEEHSFSDAFVAYLLKRSLRFEEDLVDQLLNSSEQRLARMLLLLAQFQQEGRPDEIFPKVSQETLAELVGTTRSRVNFFMTRFRQLGFIQYNDGIEIDSALLNKVLHGPNA